MIVKMNQPAEGPCLFRRMLNRECLKLRITSLPDDVVDEDNIVLIVEQLIGALKMSDKLFEVDREEVYRLLFCFVLFEVFESFFDRSSNTMKDFTIQDMKIEGLEVILQLTIDCSDDDVASSFYLFHQFLMAHELSLFANSFAFGSALSKKIVELEQDCARSILPEAPLVNGSQNGSRRFRQLSDVERSSVQEWKSDRSKIDYRAPNIDLMLLELFFSQSPKGASIPKKSSAAAVRKQPAQPSPEEVPPPKKSVQFTEKTNGEFPALVNGIGPRLGEPGESPAIQLMALIQNFVKEYTQKNGFEFFMSSTQLNDMILDDINAAKSEDAFFNDLLNLLGEDQLEFIQRIVQEFAPAILKEKSALVAVSQAQPYQGPSGTSDFAEEAWNIVKNKKTGNKFGSIVVQTEKEKNLKKNLQKIEKKMQRQMKSHFKTVDELCDGTQKLSVDDLEAMRMDNLHKNINAALEPRFKQPLPPTKPTEKYPFVFDLMQDIRMSSAYVADVKLQLPHGFERRDMKFYEEYTIPVLSSNEDTQEFLKQFQRVDISKTDEFIQTGFRGFESLNLIQSTVFQIAYMQDNKNMLICAPTGAGKTNIAMLSILNILKGHTLDGTMSGIQLDKFKIVYIAPMKALCAEMADTFGKRLQPFGIKVRELTGDMQLTSKEIMETQMLVVTPEKWDVVTRKSVGDVQLLDLVRLIILDEVHLLQSDRGHVIETIVARTIRYVETAQKCIRLVGLSATLPNYIDVAQFLHVDLHAGLFAFDERFRPVPLKKNFIGVRTTNRMQLNKDMDEITFKKAKEVLTNDDQVMVFVHSRNATQILANFLLERAKVPLPGETSVASLFAADHLKMHGSEKLINRARYRQLSRFLENGIGIHHAGMPRPERNIVEKLFHAGVIKVLVSTSTLAWGVNLPAHAVIIRGTEFYDPSQGQMVDIDMLDVMQIFGRAGRPQFDTDGEATIITSHSKLAHYLGMLTNQLPIESKFLKRLTDNLNAEIVLGTVSSIGEAVEWLRYSYAYIRMQANPLEYGLKHMAAIDPSMVIDHLYSLIRASAEALDRAEMIRYTTDAEGALDATHLGRIASHFYIQHETIVHFNTLMRPTMDSGHILQMFSKAQEFSQLKFREEELEDLRQLRNDENSCPLGAVGEVSNTHTKVYILLQTAISNSGTTVQTLSSDLMYIQQNMSRLSRGLFEYVLKRGWPLLAQRLLNVSLMFDKKIWDFDSPLRQFESEIGSELMRKISDFDYRGILRFDALREMPSDEIGNILHNKKCGQMIQRLARVVPSVFLQAEIKPITRTILTVYVDVCPDFDWDDKWHGKTSQIYWLWLTDMSNNHIYHSELAKFSKKQVYRQESQRYVMTIPLLDAQKLEQQYILHCSFEHWLGASFDLSISCGSLMLPDKHLPNTPLLDLNPLPVRALKNEIYEMIYPYSHFNPIQTQVFHTLYHIDNNVLLGAPTGSGKTAVAELAIFRVFNTRPDAKVVYIAPLKALVRERVDDWKIKIQRQIGKNVVELTGDTTPDIRTIQEADLIVTTPEKWDGVSRGWPSRSYVRKVALIVIDEIHLLGEERGPVLEMIVSRANFIARRTDARIRIVGLSTAVANAQDLAAWLNINKVGLYNFSASVRPVPIEVHVSGFPGKHYCPRMATMNKPAWKAIKKYSPTKPVIIFVASRRQTRVTALDLISLIAADSFGMQTMRMSQDELASALENVLDSHLKHTLSFGIGMHHAGLKESDRKIVEELFAAEQIQILITTATLAWGVNLPAHAVIVKGTEFFDGKKGRYVDFPITDVLQMIGRAGRPQFDTSAVAILYVHDIKKEYYKKFLYEPFPVESHLLETFSEHLNAEIMSKSVQTKHEAMEYLSSTYLYHRICKNPSFYGVDLRINENSEEMFTSEGEINQVVLQFLSNFIDQCVQTLVNDYCVTVVEEEDGSRDGQTLVATPLGKIAAYYYLNHSTVRKFQDMLGSCNVDQSQKNFTYLTIAQVLNLLTKSPEYATLPVRHNEELTNEELSRKCPIKMSQEPMESPHTKAHLLIQAHCSRLALPIVDYYTDLKTVLDQAIRILQSMLDVSSLNGSLPTTLNVISLQQSIVQASWQDSNQLLMLIESANDAPLIDNDMNDSNAFYKNFENQRDNTRAKIAVIEPEVASIPYLMSSVFNAPEEETKNVLRSLLQSYRLEAKTIDRIHNSLLRLPLIHLEEISIAAEDNSERQRVDHQAIFKNGKNLNRITLKRNSEYFLQVRLRRQLPVGERKPPQKAFAPKFPKPKTESWYLVLGVENDQELIAFSRAGPITRQSQFTLQFKTPTSGQVLNYTLYLLSDSYVGLDQQYLVPVQTQ